MNRVHKIVVWCALELFCVILSYAFFGNLRIAAEAICGINLMFIGGGVVVWFFSKLYSSTAELGVADYLEQGGKEYCDQSPTQEAAELDLDSLVGLRQYLADYSDDEATGLSEQLYIFAHMREGYEDLCDSHHAVRIMLSDELLDEIEQHLVRNTASAVSYRVAFMSEAFATHARQAYATNAGLLEEANLVIEHSIKLLNAYFNSNGVGGAELHQRIDIWCNAVRGKLDKLQEEASCDAD